MYLKRRIFKVLATLILLVAVPHLVQAQVTIPAGSTIDQAIFSIYVNSNNLQTVTLHRITADWGEHSVTWNSFGGSFDSSIIASFLVDAVGWKTIDVTTLVQNWVNGTYPNYGILLKQETVPLSVLISSEYDYGTAPQFRPKLEIWYTPPGGTPDYVIIQRPGSAQDGVADAWITQINPALNLGGEVVLITGNPGGYKLSLVRFHFTVAPPDSCARTPGYWKNHPDAWPVDVITIGGIPYTKEDAIAIMKMKIDGDKTYNMFNQLVAAKLNVLKGNVSSCIADFISNADDWMATYGPAGSGVHAGGDDSPWREGEPIHEMLDNYNNGKLCAPECD